MSGLKPPTYQGNALNEKACGVRRSVVEDPDVGLCGGGGRDGRWWLIGEMSDSSSADLRGGRRRCGAMYCTPSERGAFGICRSVVGDPDVGWCGGDGRDGESRSGAHPSTPSERGAFGICRSVVGDPDV